MPNGIWIGSGFTDIMELVVGIVYNKPGPGFEVFDWDKTQEIPDEILDRVIGLKMDTETINHLQKKYNGRGILLGELRRRNPGHEPDSSRMEEEVRLLRSAGAGRAEALLVCPGCSWTAP